MRCISITNLLPHSFGPFFRHTLVLKTCTMIRTHLQDFLTLYYLQLNPLCPRVKRFICPPEQLAAPHKHFFLTSPTLSNWFQTRCSLFIIRLKGHFQTGRTRCSLLIISLKGHLCVANRLLIFKTEENYDHF